MRSRSRIKSSCFILYQKNGFLEHLSSDFQRSLVVDFLLTLFTFPSGGKELFFVHSVLRLAKRKQKAVCSNVSITLVYLVLLFHSPKDTNFISINLHVKCQSPGTRKIGKMHNHRWR